MSNETFQKTLANYTNLSNSDKEKFESVYKYYYSFVDNTNFEDKRFDRFVEKVKIELLNYINDAFIKINGGKKIVDLEVFMFAILENHFLCDTDYDGKSLGNDISKYVVPNFDLMTDETINSLKRYFNSYNVKQKKQRDGFFFSNVFSQELKNVCKEYIRWKSVSMKNVEFSNYFITLPNTMSDCVYLLNKLVNSMRIDIERFATSNFGNAYQTLFDNGTMNLLSEYKNNAVNSENKVTKLELENIELRKTIESLKNEVHEKTLNQEELAEQFKVQNVILKNQNSKICNKYNSLFDKYTKLKEQMKIEDRTIETFVELKELDFDGKYLFVVLDDVTFKDKIKENFKNALFSENNIELNDTYDMVIIMTEHISHSTYYSIKAQCKNKKIPYIHCGFSNIDLIKELMWNEINL